MNAEAAFTGRPDIDLELMRPAQKPGEFLALALRALDAVLEEQRPSMVLAQGDTATTFAATLTAFHRRIRVGHIEAGLRTYDLERPFPEEGYRQMVDRVADRLYAPTQAAADNLQREGRKAADIVVTGNTGIDALLNVARSSGGVCRGEAPFVLATFHRREAFGEPMRRMFRALGRIADAGIGVVLPLHPNPEVGKAAREALAGRSKVTLCDPLPYPDTVKTMQKALCVVTDSGGIQEEAPTLGVPVLVAREATERLESVEAGAARLVGHDEDLIVSEVLRLRDDVTARAKMARPVMLFGDGLASQRIVADLLGNIGGT
jgi:UDP-N-acetylglucosamine 2-epimerase (non-hydrolysing)